LGPLCIGWMPCIIRALATSHRHRCSSSDGINSGASRTMNLHRPYAPSAASSPLRSIASLLSHSTPCNCDPCVERCLLLPPGDSSPLAFWPQRANAASWRPCCIVGIKRRSSPQCLVRLHPLSTLFYSSFQRPPQSHYCLAGSNDAWRQHPWLKAKHNIRYMCVHAAPRTPPFVVPFQLDSPPNPGFLDLELRWQFLACTWWASTFTRS
jgi:hypothetical protein